MDNVDCIAETIGRAVVAEVAPEELQYVDIVVQRFRLTPSRPPKAKDVNERLGFGVELGDAISPLIFWLSGVAVNAAKNQIEEGVSGTVAAWIKKVLLSLRNLFSGSSNTSPSDIRNPRLVKLNLEEIREIRALVKNRAELVGGLSANKAEAIADAITGKLVAAS